jgi:hypothetical protein
MFYFLVAIAAIFFITHVVLLLLSFPQLQLAQGRYFYSHLTLWLTGLVVFILAWFYNGESGALSYFDTPFKKSMILVFTVALSAVAHSIVRFVVVPLLGKNKR